MEQHLISLKIYTITYWSKVKSEKNGHNTNVLIIDKLITLKRINIPIIVFI